MSTYTKINTAVDAMNTMLSAATDLGWATGITIHEKDEHPIIPAERGELPKVYNIPVMEGGMEIDTTIDTAMYLSFPMTIVAYYLGTDVDTDLRTTRNYGLNFVDKLRTTNNFGEAWLTGAHLDVGYWEAVDRVIHYWACKVEFKILST